LEAMW